MNKWLFDHFHTSRHATEKKKFASISVLCVEAGRCKWQFHEYIIAAN